MYSGKDNPTTSKKKDNWHNPTNNPKQLKASFVGVVLLLVKNHTTTPGVWQF
jgi:hypothetical protein